MCVGVATGVRVAVGMGVSVGSAMGVAVGAPPRPPPFELRGVAVAVGEDGDTVASRPPPDWSPSIASPVAVAAGIVGVAAGVAGLGCCPGEISTPTHSAAAKTIDARSARGPLGSRSS